MANVKEAYWLPSWRLHLRVLGCDCFKCFRPHGLCGESVERFRLHAWGGTKKLPLQIGFCVTWSIARSSEVCQCRLLVHAVECQQAAISAGPSRSVLFVCLPFLDCTALSYSTWRCVCTRVTGSDTPTKTTRRKTQKILLADNDAIKVFLISCEYCFSRRLVSKITFSIKRLHPFPKVAEARVRRS